MAARDPKNLDLGTVPLTLVPDPNEANENYATNDIVSGAFPGLSTGPEEPGLGVYDEYPVYTTGAGASTSGGRNDKVDIFNRQTSDYTNS